MHVRRLFFYLGSLVLGVLLLTTHPAGAQVTGASGSSVPDFKAKKSAVAPPAPEKPGSTWSFLPLEACHVESFRREHSEYDGRGTIILIFDTGVDPGLQGLESTTTSKQKLIDLMDFSGSGDVTYREATRVGDDLLQDGKVVLKLTHALTSGKYYYGALFESRFRNGLGDLNFNDTKTDTFGVLLYEDAANHFSVAVDGDGDHSLANDKWVSNFREKFETFQFRPSNSASEKRRLNAGVTVYPDKKLVNLFFDDGSHGSHVAGIAAGNNIDGVDGFNGVAPGAELIAVKIADNTTGGTSTSGAMQKGFLFAAGLARSQSKPVIVNMSFGIGNELEGDAAMDFWLDSLLEETPNLTVCIAGGNEGPSISTIGLPGSADRVITSGAMLPAEAAHDLFGVVESTPLIFDFSSRGGELAEPDIVSPGVAVSTVPDYVGGDRYSGTSMASPFTTGCAAVLLGAMREKFEGYIPNASMLKRAMQLSATHIPGATPLDEGYGLIDVPKAFELLSMWHTNHESHEGYGVRAIDPLTQEKTRAAYFRNGFIAGQRDRVTFQVLADETDSATANLHAFQFKAFDLVSDSPWLEPVQSSVYRRGVGGLPIDVRYKHELLTAPGIYTGVVRAFPKRGKPLHAASEEAFRLVNTVVVPYEFHRSAGNRIAIDDIELRPGHPQRFFFDIPIGTKAYRLTIGTRNPTAIATVHINDPSGKEFDRFTLRSEGADRFGTHTVSGELCKPGVIEIDLARSQIFEDEGNARFDFTCEILPIDIAITSQSTRGESAELRYDIYNGTTRMIEMPIRGEIHGYERSFDTLISEGELYALAFHPRSGEKSAEFTIELPKQDYNLFTDIALRVSTPDSDAVFNSAFDYATKTAHVNFTGDTSLRYELVLTGGLALPDHPHPFHLHIRERRELDPPSTVGRDDATDLPPGANANSKIRFATSDIELPVGYRFFGELMMKVGGEIKVVVPFHF